MNRVCIQPSVVMGASRRTLLRIAEIMTMTALLSGCVFVAPVPTAYHPAGSRRNLTEDTAKHFTPGSATVDDVVLALGEPDESPADASRLTYRWERVNLHLVWGWFIPAADATAGQAWERVYSRIHSATFEFDGAGVLQNLATTNEDFRTTMDVESR